MDNSNVFRIDFGEIHPNKKSLSAFNKKLSMYKRTGERKAKPENCLLCGMSGVSFCNSHSIPQFCLKNITTDGKTKTLNQAIGVDFLPYEVGLNRTGTFKLICKKCDGTFFADYERAEYYYEGKSLSNTLLASVATKVCLLEKYKARQQVGMLEEVPESTNFDLSNMGSIRKQDEIEDDIQLNYALAAIKGVNNGYKLFIDYYLPYTVPIAFQGQLNLVCDYKGRIINDIFNFSPSYRIEPLYACVFPLGSGTRVFVFSRNDGFARYARFYRWLKSLSRRKCLDVLLKLIIAYTEEEYFCPDLPDSIFKNPGFKKLACTSNLNLLLDPDLTSLTTKGIVSEFSISNFPDIPELLSRNYSVETLRAIDS